MRFADDSKKMFLSGYYPGTAPDQILDHMQFGIDCSRAKAVPPPESRELSILRERCDPQRLILG